LELRARRLHKIEDRFVETKRPAEWVTGHHHPHAAVSLALMIKGKFDFGTKPKRPFGQQTHAFGRPLDVFLNEID